MGLMRILKGMTSNHQPIGFLTLCFDLPSCFLWHVINSAGQLGPPRLTLLEWLMRHTIFELPEVDAISRATRAPTGNVSGYAIDQHWSRMNTSSIHMPILDKVRTSVLSA